jgi:hypothetical protein
VSRSGAGKGSHLSAWDFSFPLAASVPCQFFTGQVCAPRNLRLERWAGFAHWHFGLWIQCMSRRDFHHHLISVATVIYSLKFSIIRAGSLSPRALLALSSARPHQSFIYFPSKSQCR